MNWTILGQTVIWAITLTGIAVFALNKFSHAFSGMVNRVKKLGPAEFEASAVPALVQADEKPGNAIANATALIAVTPGSVVEDRVNLAREVINAVPPELRLEQAARLAGFMGFLANAEWLNATIYGSQLAALQVLNTRALSIAEMQSYHEAAVRQSPERYAGYSFEQWLAWMMDNAQITVRHGDQVLVSKLGREFLKHLVDRGYSLHRPL